MILFALSFIFTFLTAYFIASVLAKSDALKGFVFTAILAFSQIILISELLSVFYKIREIPFLSLNLLFLAVAFFVWYKAGKPVFKPNLKHFLKLVFNSCKLDKYLILLIIGWIVFVIVSVVLIILLPATSGDAYTYHVVRSYDWVINQSLSHYETADIRCLTFPINSELLYMWVILFTKRQLFLGSFSFVGYLLFLICGYQIFKFVGFSTRRTLWTLLATSSFASVIVMVSGTETDLVIAGLITSSIYLFMDAVKHKSENIALYMSSLFYAIAVGVKTPAIICIPAVALLFFVISFKFKDKFSIIKFIGFGFINFILFSSFNYVLNFLNYGDIMGTQGIIYLHKNCSGLKGLFANMIMHFFLLIDFSGFKVSANIVEYLFSFEFSLLHKLNLGSVPLGLYSGKYFFNSSLTEPGMGCGIFSFLLVIPCFLISLLMPIFNKSRLNKVRFMFALMFLINMVALSALIVFMTFNTRFITAFILISAPMLACSYFKSNKNLLKIFYVLVIFFYFTVISTHLWGRPFFRIVHAAQKDGIVKFRSGVLCRKYDKRTKKMDEWCNINSLLDSKFNNKNNKILFMPDLSEYIIYSKTKKLQNHQYDFINAEHLKNVDIDSYDVIIINQKGQLTNVFDKDGINYSKSEGLNSDNSTMEYFLDQNSELLCSYIAWNDIFIKGKKLTTEKACNFTKDFYKNHPFTFGYRTSEYYFLINTDKYPEFKTK